MGSRVENLGPSTFRLSRSACLTMLISAAEVYPRECMGGISCNRSDVSRVVSAHPWQKAKRKYLEVVSESSYEVSKLLSKKSHWTLFCDYHSHTFRTNERLGELEPSSQDLKSLEDGGVEFIVRIHKVKKSDFFMISHRSGWIEASLGKFRFQIKVFQRLPALDDKKIPLYKTLRVKLS